MKIEGGTLVDVEATCTNCGTTLTGAAKGLCRRCLFLRGMGGAPEAHDAHYETEAESPPIGRIGDYELIERLARGGSGVVYSARDLKLKRMVALKLLAGRDFAAPDFVERFRREAKAASSLDHPNIVPLYEFGEWEGQSFLCMRLIQGVNLAQRIAVGLTRLSGAEAARIMAKIARAVHYAHQR